MAAEFNYYGVWLIYLLASLIFLSAYWRLTRFPRWSGLKHFFRCLVLALIFTPWFASSDGDTLAPALMVITLDAITMGLGEASRALTPLLLSLFVAVLFALILSVRDKRKSTNKRV